MMYDQPPAIIQPAKKLIKPQRQLWRPSMPAIIIGFGAAAAGSGVSSPPGSPPDSPSNWDPTQLGSALKGWYRAFSTGATNVGVFNTGTTPATDTQTVATWHDESGNNFDFLSTGSNKPTWLASGINGHPAVRLDVTGVQGLLATIGNVFGGALSVYCIAYMGASTAANGRLIGMCGTAGGGDAASNTIIPLVRDGSNNQIASFWGGSGFAGVQALATGSGNFKRLAAVYDGSILDTYVNNVSSGSPLSASITFGTTQSFSLGAEINNGPALGTASCWDGAVGEILLVNRADATDRANVDAYLAAKYA